MTGSGKVMARHAGKQHFNEKMTRDEIRCLGMRKRTAGVSLLPCSEGTGPQHWDGIWLKDCGRWPEWVRGEPWERQSIASEGDKSIGLEF